MPAIEIDVSALRDANFAALEPVLFASSLNTKWLHHPTLGSVEASMLAGLELVLKTAEIEAEETRHEWERDHAEQERVDAIRSSSTFQPLTSLPQSGSSTILRTF